MILYQSGVIKLEYDPAYDVLFMEWPDFQELLLPEIKFSIDKLVECLRDYDVKNLLIDVSKSTVKVSDAEYRSIMQQFIQSLIMKTRLSKMARIKTADPVREQRVDALRQEMSLTFGYKLFTDRAAALAWLQQS